MRIRESLARTGHRLRDGGIPDHSIEAEVVLRHVLNVDRAEFFVALDEYLAPEQEVEVHHELRRRLEGEPLPYITGHREFYGLDFVVSPQVLIPRQETELLVDTVLEFASAKRVGQTLQIADVGTGSGAIAIAIARNLPRATIFATDLSREALKIADVNRRRHGVSDRVHLCQGDLLGPLGRPVDIIVSNPPYLRTDEMADLSDELRREPQCALDGGADGLRLTGRLLWQARTHARPGGCVLVEIAPGQLEDVSRIAREAIPGARISFARDLLSLPRAVIAGWSESADTTKILHTTTSVVESGNADLRGMR